MPQRLEGSVEVNAPVQQVYEYWETLENLPNFMRNVEQVRSIGDNLTHWSVKGPLGASVEFDARTTQNERNEAIAWNSEDGDIQTSGQVRFRELDDDRTRIEVQMNWFDPPGGKVGEAVSGLVAGPKTILEQDLKNFKDLMEGEATPEEIQERTNAAQPHTAAVAFLTSSTGLLVLGGGLLLWLLLRGTRSRRKPGKARIIFEF
ncbi:MAG TPA: SRPBCC family protein [Rubrobacteraceae bacterium]|nr:SRPBCC family protein [Rubrobacteraceae bacterium]